MNFITNLLTKLVKKKICLKKDFEIILSRVLIIVFFLFIIPILLIGYYNYMSADDFCTSIQTYNIFQHNRNIYGIWLSICESINLMIDNWKYWCGCYTSIFFSGIIPAAYSPNMIFLHTLILVGSFIMGNYYFWKVFLEKYVETNKNVANIIFIVVTALMIQWVPSAVSAFYWYDGAFYNIVGLSSALVLLGMVGKYIHSMKTIKTGKLVIMIFFTIFLAGTNYSTILVIIIIVALDLFNVLLESSILKKNKQCYVLIAVILLSLSLLSILAPGNQVRQQQYVEPVSPIITILIALLRTRGLIQQYCDYKVILLLIFITPFIWKEIKENSNKYRMPALIVVISYGLLAASLTPLLYVEQSLGEARTWNVYYWICIILIFVNYIYFLGWLKTKLTDNNIKFKIGDRMLPYFLITYVGIIAVFFPLDAIADMTSIKAASSLFSGEAAKYKSEVDERINLYENSNEDELYFEEFSVKPELLYYSDITEDTENWVNQGTAAFYGKKKIGIRK